MFTQNQWQISSERFTALLDTLDFVKDPRWAIEEILVNAAADAFPSFGPQDMYTAIRSHVSNHTNLSALYKFQAVLLPVSLNDLQLTLFSVFHISTASVAFGWAQATATLEEMIQHAKNSPSTTNLNVAEIISTADCYRAMRPLSLKMCDCLYLMLNFYTQQRDPDIDLSDEFVHKLVEKLPTLRTLFELWALTLIFGSDQKLSAQNIKMGNFVTAPALYRPVFDKLATRPINNISNLYDKQQELVITNSITMELEDSHQAQLQALSPPQQCRLPSVPFIFTTPSPPPHDEITTVVERTIEDTTVYIDKPSVESPVYSIPQVTDRISTKNNVDLHCQITESPIDHIIIDLTSDAESQNKTQGDCMTALSGSLDIEKSNNTNTQQQSYSVKKELVPSTKLNSPKPISESPSFPSPTTTSSNNTNVEYINVPISNFFDDKVLKTTISKVQKSSKKFRMVSGNDTIKINKYGLILIPQKDYALKRFLLKQFEEMKHLHTQREELTKEILKWFHWPELNEDLDWYIPYCENCQIKEKYLPTLFCNKQVEHLIFYPFAQPHIFKITLNSFETEICLTIMCRFTQYIIGIPVLLNTNNENIIERILEAIKKIGKQLRPIHLSWDDGLLCLETKDSETWLKKKGIKRVPKESFHPLISFHLAERCNEFLKLIRSHENNIFPLSFSFKLLEQLVVKQNAINIKKSTLTPKVVLNEYTCDLTKKNKKAGLELAKELTNCFNRHTHSEYTKGLQNEFKVSSFFPENSLVFVALPVNQHFDSDLDKAKYQADLSLVNNMKLELIGPFSIVRANQNQYGCSYSLMMPPAWNVNGKINDTFENQYVILPLMINVPKDKVFQLLKEGPHININNSFLKIKPPVYKSKNGKYLVTQLENSQVIVIGIRSPSMLENENNRRREKNKNENMIYDSVGVCNNFSNTEFQKTHQVSYDISSSSTNSQRRALNNIRGCTCKNISGGLSDPLCSIHITPIPFHSKRKYDNSGDDVVKRFVRSNK
ncbi:uncharacterized protein SAPINGB_P002937 [Magnusiomyces paraingens]|uniref:Uncharacterized protein n=1 Tax=Magnusiomyces paraingens TaxID=2606893 RepID=A0A5E8BIX6_9ASCO|nr:uncharacterized protein SAPINGB_P002937 [Saprochaete ingens]VVT50959.1 unnamed protein product [Saprochaete ingens]